MQTQKHNLHVVAHLPCDRLPQISLPCDIHIPDFRFGPAADLLAMQVGATVLLPMTALPRGICL